MIAKFSEAIHLLARHLGLLAAIVLTVELPINIFLNYVSNNVAMDPSDAVRAAMLVEGIFSPISAAALIYALFEIKSGRHVTYKEALAVGFKKWGPLFAARFVVGFLILGGLILFVIPGVIVLVRYALMDAAVVLEGEGTAGARARSAKLTSGRRWQIFGAAALFFFLFVPLSVAASLPMAFVESLNTMPVVVALDCLTDIVYAVIQIVMFLFYWEAIQEESSEGEAPDGDSTAEPWDPKMAQAWSGADDNPYRAPLSE